MSVTSTSAGEPTSLAGRDLALLVLMNLIWGLNLIASKIGVGEFPPIFFTALRFGSLALFLVPMLKIHRGQMVNLFAAAMLTGPAAFALLFAGIYLAEDAATVAVASQMGVPFSTPWVAWSLGRLPAALTAVTVLIQPVVAAVLGWILFAETMTGAQLAGAATLLAGVLLAQWSSRQRKGAEAEAAAPVP